MQVHNYSIIKNYFTHRPEVMAKIAVLYCCLLTLLNTMFINLLTNTIKYIILKKNYSVAGAGQANLSIYIIAKLSIH